MFLILNYHSRLAHRIVPLQPVGNTLDFDTNVWARNGYILRRNMGIPHLYVSLFSFSLIPSHSIRSRMDTPHYNRKPNVAILVYMRRNSARYQRDESKLPGWLVSASVSSVVFYRVAYLHLFHGVLSYLQVTQNIYLFFMLPGTYVTYYVYWQ